MGRHGDGEKKWEKSGLVIGAVVTCLIGLIILESFFIYDYYRYSNSIYESIIKPTIQNLAIAIIVFGFGSLGLEVNGYTKYFKKRIAEVFTNGEMLNYLSKDSKKDLYDNLLQDLYAVNSDDGKEVMDLFVNKIGDSTKGKYYEKRNFSIVADVISDMDGNKYIHKSICSESVINVIDADDEYYLDTLIETHCVPINANDMKAFTISRIIVDGQELQMGKDYEIKINSQTNRGEYKQHYLCELKRRIKIDKPISYKIQYETNVPYKDRIYSIKLNLLCKSLQVSILLKDDEYIAHPIGFKFSNSPDNKIDLTPMDSMVSVNSNGWVLPGEGVAFIIVDKFDN